MSQQRNTMDTIAATHVVFGSDDYDASMAIIHALENASIAFNTKSVWRTGAMSVRFDCWPTISNAAPPMPYDYHMTAEDMTELLSMSTLEAMMRDLDMELTDANGDAFKTKWINDLKATITDAMDYLNEAR